MVHHLGEILLIRIGSDVPVCFTNGDSVVGRVIRGGMDIKLLVSRFNDVHIIPLS